MAIKLMFITNRPDVALIAERSGVDRIFIDMEYIRKAERQGDIDSVKNHHTVDDVKRIKRLLTSAELLVRVNPIHTETEEYTSSEDEIRAVIEAGADLVMLPFFRTVNEVERFIDIVAGRTKTMLLLETPEAVNCVDEILAISGIDEIHIGLNDLSIGYKKTFMFEPLADGTVEKLCCKFRKAGIPYGFGGMAYIGEGELPAELILKEHYRLGSSMVILSRSFCTISENTNISYVDKRFLSGVRKIRECENEIVSDGVDFEKNRRLVCGCVDSIVRQIKFDRSDSNK